MKDRLKAAWLEKGLIVGPDELADGEESQR